MSQSYSPGGANVPSPVSYTHLRAHNPNDITISSAVFAQMTVESPYTLQWAIPSSSKLPLPMGDLDRNLVHGSMGPPESSTQMASRLLQLFLQGSLV